MFARYFFGICAVALFVAVVSGKPLEDDEEVRNELLQPDYELDEVELRAIANRSITDEIVKILQEAFTWAAENCLKEAAKQCKKYWIRPKKLVSCAKDYFKENQGDCAIPEINF